MSRLEPELLALIGEDAVVRLAEAFGGTVIYVPQKITPRHPIAEAVGIDAARALVGRFAPDEIPVPLARDLRARHYARRHSQPEIARLLGMTQSGVEKMFARLRQGELAKRQGDLFAN